MAQIVSNNFVSQDRFNVRCPICGSEIVYFRKEVRAHVRWKNGFIYCPKCKNPLGHDEANIIEKGEERFSNVSEEELKKYTKEIRVLKILRAIFVPVGIVTLVASVIMLMLLATKVLPSSGIQEYTYKMYLFAFLFMLGLGMLIASGVFKAGIRNRQAVIEHNQ